MRMRVLTSGGVKDVDVDSAHSRSIVGSYWNGIQGFLATGDTGLLAPYQTVTINGHLLLTDPDEIERLARIGDLDIDGIYGDAL